jgi:hypothetical protein
MQPQQPQTPSEAQTPSDASPAEERSDQPEGTSDQAPSWWRRLFRGGHAEGEADGGSSGDQDAAEAQASSEKSAPSAEELLERRVQAEVDRREAKRERERKAEEKRKLRDEDPWQYAEQERQAEQQALANSNIESIFTTIGAEHDKHTIDPVMQALPKEEQQRILGLEGAGVGLEGRRLVVAEALKSLEKHWKAEGGKDAEARLRKNPAFRKQVLAEMRGVTPEPELVPSGNTSSNGRSGDLINNMLRRQVGISTND